MPVFEYLTFMCDYPELQAELSKYGLERWRLHTCEPVVKIGLQGSGTIQVLIVMDRVVEESAPEEEVVIDNDALKGMAMR